VSPTWFMRSVVFGRVAMNDLSAAEVLRRHEAELRRLPDVTGVGVGEDADGREVIVVFVREGVDDLEAVRARLPEVVDGYGTEVRPEIRVYPGRYDEGEGT
jgi:hypothetical protein